MPQSLAQIYLLIVFSTKNRTPRLCDENLRAQLYAYIATILRDNAESRALIINGFEDHLHAWSGSAAGLP
jgi:REP element-mobilizing transposase RayT